MKFKDLKTGAVLVTSNELVIEQFNKQPDRYKEVTATQVKQTAIEAAAKKAKA